MVAITKFCLLVGLVTLHLTDVNYGQLLFGLNPQPEDARLDFIGLATKYGHRPMQYEVTTDDGYLLTLFRIPGISQYPVLLTHGFLESSDTWLLRGRNSLGITLAKDRYDVWFPNSRGNRYSRKHLFLDPNKDASYWNWSFHEIGYYDLPAIIDKILSETRASSVTAIGHSRGNEIFYILGSTRPEYNSKINVMIALAPIAFLRNTQPPVSVILEAVTIFYRQLRAFRVDTTEFLGYNSESTTLLREFCTYPPLVANELCLNLIFFPIIGYDPTEIESSFVNIFIYHFPAGSSWKDVLHFSQLRTDFAQFDYGTDQNLVVYNTKSPPSYNLTRVTMPIALLVGRNDHLSTLADVEILMNRLPNVVDYTINRWILFNHLDIVWGRNMRVHIFPDIYRILRRYNRV